MKFSLVLATVERTAELPRFLASLDSQTTSDFELIVVDQNPDDRLVPILEPYAGRFPIRHLRSQRGLSRARNIGIQHAKGELVGFPDDDCWYPPDLLDQVCALLDQHPEAAGITGRAMDAAGKPTAGKWSPLPGFITKINAWWQGTSISLFLRRSALQALNGFDETLGLGAGTPWGSAEDRELLIRAAENGFAVYYDPRLAVGHPADTLAALLPNRGYSYSLAVGHVLKTHRYPLWFVLYMLARPLGGILTTAAACNRPQLAYHWSVFKGRLYGSLQ